MQVWLERKKTDIKLFPCRGKGHRLENGQCNFLSVLNVRSSTLLPHHPEELTAAWSS